MRQDRLTLDSEKVSRHPGAEPFTPSLHRNRARSRRWGAQPRLLRKPLGKQELPQSTLCRNVPGLGWGAAATYQTFTRIAPKAWSQNGT